MNTPHPTITIDLVLDRHTTKEVLQAVLHAILFHRLFGLVKPQTFEVLDVTLPGVSDAGMEALVNEKVDAFWRGVEGGVSKRGQALPIFLLPNPAHVSLQITVTFSEKRPKKSWFQVYMGEEDVPWEQWIINAELRQPKSERDRQNFLATLAATLTKAVQTMLVHTSSEKGRTAVPPITNAGGISPFPISVVVTVGGVEVG
ncbi:autophagy-related protein [Mycena belliarum]|uniref:Autophagy-related protein 101 n=1 Tax=Mycena belliarum TaxID=1033014 RepID=A0AAD6TZM5_9AGAR|nr:autophagy-related protein [Mycena belliae]